MPPLILIVDDDPVAQGDTRRLLQLAGYAMLTADTAIDALTYLKNGQVPDLAILELRLADLPGVKLATRIHAQKTRVPILFVSGWAEEATPLAQLAGIRWEYLRKPYTQEMLLPAVERLLGAKTGDTAGPEVT